MSTGVRNRRPDARNQSLLIDELAHLSSSQMNRIPLNANASGEYTAATSASPLVLNFQLSARRLYNRRRVKCGPCPVDNEAVSDESYGAMVARLDQSRFCIGGTEMLRRGRSGAFGQGSRYVRFGASRAREPRSSLSRSFAAA